MMYYFGVPQEEARKGVCTFRRLFLKLINMEPKMMYYFGVPVEVSGRGKERGMHF